MFVTFPFVSYSGTPNGLLKGTHRLRSSDTGRGTSRHCPGLQRSQPGPGCTGACCSRPGVPPPQRLIPLPPRRTLSFRLHGCWRSASSSWRNHHRRPRWKAGLWQTLWHRRQALSWRPCCFWAFDKAKKEGEGWNVFMVGRLEVQGWRLGKVTCSSNWKMFVFIRFQLQGGPEGLQTLCEGLSDQEVDLFPHVCGAEGET